MMWFPKTVPKRKYNAVKTLNIKNFKGTPTVPAEFVDREWEKLRLAIINIHHDLDPKESYEVLYRIVDNLCKLDFKLFLLQNVSALTSDYLVVKLEELLRYHNLDLLYRLAETWQKFYEQTKILRNIFLPLDGAASAWKCNTVLHIRLNAFKNKIMLHHQLQMNFEGSLLDQIFEERTGTSINRDLMKKLSNLMSELQFFEEVFTGAFLETSYSFYVREGETLLQNFNIFSYLHHVNARIKEETDRVQCYLMPVKVPAILNVLVTTLIKNHISVVLEGMVHLLQSNHTTELSLLYALLSFANCTKNMEEYFSSYVIRRGSEIVSNPENDRNMIKDLLDFKTKIDEIVAGPFQNNASIQDVARYSFSQFINKRPNKPAELLAKYVDSILRSKQTSDSDIEEVLQKVMVIFRLVQGKDVFEAFYKKDLAKRLLLGKFTSWDVEKSMLSKLKEECGSNYTAKLEGMFKDITISNGINTTFKQHLQNTDNGNLNNVDLCITVLTSSNWPNYPTINANIPTELGRFQQTFQEFYASNHRGRKLLWQPSLGHCIVKSRFGDTNKELQVSLFQCVVLLLFNETSKLSYAEVKELTNLDDHELKRTLLSLACGKHRVLLKNPKGIEIKDDDEFCFNNGFSDKLFRIKINQIQLKETPEEQRATEESILQDRQFQIDAAIVRIMKREKYLQHNVLMTQLYAVLDIPIEPLSLKKRIEQLIEREYIERDQNNPSAYKYIA